MALESTASAAVTAVVVGLICVATSAAEAPDSLPERLPWETCFYCHGEDGAGAAAGLAGPVVPALAGRPAGVLKNMIGAFRSGERLDPNRMMAVVNTLTSNEVDRVADFFASLPSTTPR